MSITTLRTKVFKDLNGLKDIQDLKDSKDFKDIKDLNGLKERFHFIGIKTSF